MKIDVDDPLYDELRGIEARIKAGEGKSIEDRWEFGRVLRSTDPKARSNYRRVCWRRSPRSTNWKP